MKLPPTKLPLGFLLLAALLPAQVSAPRVGFARFSDGAVHAVQGLPSNLVVGDAAIAPADHASFSDSGGLIAHGGQISLLDADALPIASYPCTESSPLLNIDGALSTAIAWLPSTHSILYWDGAAFVVTEVSSGLPTGEVTGVQIIQAGKARLLVSRAGAGVSAVI